MRNYFKSFIKIMIALTPLVSLSQENPIRIDYSPQTPETSNLFDFTNTNVGYYTGSISKNIPLFNLTEGPLSVDINLSYNTSGHKVAERASWVGLGWNLNAGGMISREVRGTPDDSDVAQGFISFIQDTGYDNIQDIQLLNDVNKAALYIDLSSFGCADAQPDLFKFDIGGLNGSFMFDWDGTIKVSSNKKIIVEYSQLNNKNEITEWRIIDDNGNKYTFSKTVKNELTGVYGMGQICNNAPYTVSWKITSIEDVSASNRINFTYEDYMMEYPIVYSVQSEILDTGANGGVTSSGSGLKIYGSYIKTIKGYNSNKEVSFTKGNINRNDVTGTNLHPLEKIKIKDNNGIVVKEYNLDYIFGTRLQLKGINQIKNLSNLRLYDFEYNSNLPSNYDSYSIDHWGYYNGENNAVLYPSYTFPSPALNGTIISYPGANREANENLSKAGTLKKVIYPTKGYTKYEYEGHDYSFIQNQSISNAEAIQTPSDIVISSKSDSNNPSTWVENTTAIDVVINTSINNSNTQISQGAVVKRKVNLEIKGIDLFSFAWGVLGPKIEVFDSSNNLVFSRTIPYNANYLQGQRYIENVTLWLEDDSYFIKTKAQHTPNSNNIANYVQGYFTWSNDTDNSVMIKSAGGVRIKEIAEYDTNNALIKKKQFNYRLNDSINHSSGSIDGLPKYEDIAYYLESVGQEIYDFIPRTIRYTGNILRFGSDFGHVRYKEVTVNNVGVTNNIKTIYKYSTGLNAVISYEKPYTPAISKGYSKGLLLSETNYKTVNGSYIPVRKITNEYNYKEESVWGLKVIPHVIGDTPLFPGYYADDYYLQTMGFSLLNKTIVEDIYNNDSTVNETTYNYVNDFKRVASNTFKSSELDDITTDYIYPDTDVVNTINTTMINNNQVGTPTKIIRKKNNDLLSTQETQYKNWGGNLVLPEVISNSKGNNPARETTIVHLYDNLGNPLEVSQADNIHIAYIWGYQRQYPIAKIENATYSQVQNYINISNLQSKSNQDNDRTIGNTGKEGLLRSVLNNLRNALPDAMVTTYTYDPLIGVTSVTDPKGYVMYYEYDEFNRQEYVKDNNGDILSHNQYNYKTQN